MEAGIHIPKKSPNAEGYRDGKEKNDRAEMS